MNEIKYYLLILNLKYNTYKNNKNYFISISINQILTFFFI